MSAISETGPLVAIGGLGGSGTRVVADALRLAGIDIGGPLNASLDNLWFTTLFKRADWTVRRPPAVDVVQAADLFARAMTIGLAGRMSDAEEALIRALGRQLPPIGTWVCGARAGDAESLLASHPRKGGDPGPWGWKEPNTHVFLPVLADCFPQMRYVHVVRNGLDMAFSTNTWQARHWWSHFGLAPPDASALPVHQLQFWTASNRVILDHGTARLAGRCLVVSFEAFCADPDRQSRRLHGFLGLPDQPHRPEVPLSPSGIGRAGAQDMSQFPPALVRAAQELQSEVNCLAFQE